MVRQPFVIQRLLRTLSLVLPVLFDPSGARGRFGRAVASGFEARHWSVGDMAVTMLGPERQGPGRRNPGLVPPWKAYLGVNPQAKVRATAWGREGASQHDGDIIIHVDRAESLVVPCLLALPPASRASESSHNWPRRHRIEATRALGYTLVTSRCRSTYGSRSSGGRLITPSSSRTCPATSTKSTRMGSLSPTLTTLVRTKLPSRQVWTS